MEVNILLIYLFVAHLNIAGVSFLFTCAFFQVQLTDFENAAYVVFVVLLTRVILSYKLDFLIPLSKVKKKSATLSHSNLTTDTLSLCKPRQK